MGCSKFFGKYAGPAILDAGLNNGVRVRVMGQVFGNELGRLDGQLGSLRPSMVDEGICGFRAENLQQSIARAITL